jgi:drug/metabolite transporter (DMT)-like permease
MSVLGERLAWYHLAGFALVLIGLAVANRGAKHSERS